MQTFTKPELEMAREVGDTCILSLPVLFLLLASGCTSAVSLINIPSLGLRSPHKDFSSSGAMQSLDASNDSFQFFSYEQTLDHFNYQPDSYSTFPQRYAINFNYWGGANTSSPIFAYTGDEAGLDGDLVAGFLTDIAPRFKALVVFMEHRYYGQSLPFGSVENTYDNTETLGYFTSAQALADYAELLVSLKKNLSAEGCPVIAFGGSYGGMLASWFRLKYPHIVIGALASSAPVLYFEDLTPSDAYFTVVTKDFREISESCYQTIKQSWVEIDKIAAQPNGLSILSQKFHTCSPLSDSQQLKDSLISIYAEAAQYDDPFNKWVNATCKAIDGAPQGTDILGRIFAGGQALLGVKKCYGGSSATVDLTAIGWNWQLCTDLVMPVATGPISTMFQSQPFDLDGYIADCWKAYGVTPRAHWATTEFGGHRIKSVLEKFGSNIIYSNGLRDPYSSGGVLYNISESIVALYTQQGSHALDILAARNQDPDWLIAQRDAEVNIIESWLKQYNASSVA